jgi:hypothetical protein
MDSIFYCACNNFQLSSCATLLSQSLPLYPIHPMPRTTPSPSAMHHASPYPTHHAFILPHASCFTLSHAPSLHPMPCITLHPTPRTLRSLPHQQNQPATLYWSPVHVSAHSTASCHHYCFCSTVFLVGPGNDRRITCANHAATVHFMLKRSPVKVTHYCITQHTLNAIIIRSR